jgi:hypothetical protein
LETRKRYGFSVPSIRPLTVSQHFYHLQTIYIIHLILQLQITELDTYWLLQHELVPLKYAFICSCILCLQYSTDICIIHRILSFSLAGFVIRAKIRCSCYQRDKRASVSTLASTLHVWYVNNNLFYWIHLYSFLLKYSNKASIFLMLLCETLNFTSVIVKLRTRMIYVYLVLSNNIFQNIVFCVVLLRRTLLFISVKGKWEET